MMATLQRQALFIISMVFLVRSILSQSECNDTTTSTISQACLNSLSTLLNDETKYYFGKGYSDRCPRTDSIECFTYVPPPPYSIIGRMGTDKKMQTSNLNRWLEVKYTSPAGSYTGCDYFYKVPETTFYLNPLIEVNRTPWLTRMQPEFRWDTSVDSNDQLYTLLLQDVGYGATHTIWMNIQGNDISTATVIPRYQGPGNPRELPNVYIFFLFKQERRIQSLSPSWQQVIADLSNPSYLQLHWLDFMDDNALSGPVAVNWMTVTGDTFAAQTIADFGFTMNCAFYVDRELQKLKSERPFLPPSFTLSVFMRVNYDSTKLVLDVCCSDTEYKAEKVYLDPIGSGLVPAATTRANGSTLTVSLFKNAQVPNPSTDFLGQYHTIVMVDPDVPSSSFATNERPLAHWLVINAQNGNLSSGNEILSYRQPRPPNDEPHTYFFLLYRQMTNSTLNVVNVNAYTAGCDRCQFDLRSFADDNDLSLVGASWMRVQNDLYVNYTYAIENLPLDEEALCENVEGYTDPCPAGKGSSMYHDQFGSLVAVLLILFAIFA